MQNFNNFTEVLRCEVPSWMPLESSSSLHPKCLVAFLFFVLTLTWHVAEKNTKFHENVHANQMGVSKNSGIPKWMVYNGKPY